MPGLLRWLPDGSGLRVTLLDATSGKSTIWQITVAGGPNPSVLSVVRTGITINDCCSSLSRENRYGDAFLSGMENRENRILLLSPAGGFHPGALRLEKMNRLLGIVAGLSIDPLGKRLFVLSNSAVTADTTPVGWTDLIAFDIASRVFRPYLAGVSAEDLDYSRDGKRITWVSPFDRSLWISLPDGSRARRLAVPRQRQRVAALGSGRESDRLYGEVRGASVAYLYRVRRR